MTNKEKYGDKIIRLVVSKGYFGLKNGEPETCRDLKCEDCDFYKPKSDLCERSKHNFHEWLNSEYVEPPVDWSKVEVDTPILVKDYKADTWERRYFAKYENGKVYTWLGGATSWSTNGTDDYYMADWKMAKLAEGEE